MVIPFLGIYMSSALGFSKPQVGIVLGCFGLGSVVGSWIGGWLTDRLGSYKVQMASLLLAIPLFLLLPYFKTFHGLSALIFLLSIITDIFRPANSVAVARFAKPENITRAYSLNRMAINLGFSIGPALGGFLATYSYNLIFYGNALGAACAAIVLTIFFSKKATAAKVDKKKDDLLESESIKRNAYTDGLFLLFSVTCFFFSMAFFQLLGTLPLFYKDSYQLKPDQIGLLLGFSGFVIVVFEMILVHWAEHRFKVKQIMFWGTAMAGLSYFMLTLDYGIVWLYLAMFMLSTGEMLTLPFSATVAIQRASRNNQGAYMGLNALSFSAAHIFTAYLGTYIAEHFGYQTLWFATGFTLIACSFSFYFIIEKLLKKEF